MLKPEQLTAIEWLVQPKHGGKTYEEIAELCGVTRQTLHTWRKSAEFQDELKREVVSRSAERLGDVINAMVESAVTHKSAAAAKIILQANGMLTDKVEVKTNANAGTDIEALRSRIAALRSDNVKSEENEESYVN